MIELSDVPLVRRVNIGQIRNGAWRNWEIRGIVIVGAIRDTMLLQIIILQSLWIVAAEVQVIPSAELVACGLWSIQKELGCGEI